MTPWSGPTLRPHHLLCILTYEGKGYDAAFVANMDRVVARLSAGEPARMTDRPDSICQPMLAHEDCHCRLDRIQSRDDAARADLEPLLGQSLEPGNIVVLDKDRIARLRRAFAAGTVRGGCRECAWRTICDRMAASDFRGAHLSP